GSVGAQVRLAAGGGGGADRRRPGDRPLPQARPGGDGPPHADLGLERPPERGKEGLLMRVNLTVNGAAEAVDDVWEGESLLYVLRERMGLPGSKNACEQGECRSEERRVGKEWRSR